MFRSFKCSVNCCSPFPSMFGCLAYPDFHAVSPSLAVGSSSSCCWFISMSLVLHSTEIWLGMRQTPVEWRTTEPMDGPYCTWKTWVSLSHINIPGREAQLGHLCPNLLEEAWNSAHSQCLGSAMGSDFHWLNSFPHIPVVPSLISPCNNVARPI